MTVGSGEEKPDCRVRTLGQNGIEVESSSTEGRAIVKIDLTPRGAGAPPILEAEY